MNRLALLLLFPALLFCININAKNNKSKHHHQRLTAKPIAIAVPEPIAVFKFKGGDTYDFKSVKKDATVTHSFQFTNTGNKALYIDNVTTSCSCAKAKWDVEPVLPGMKGHISVTLDARELKGEFYKELYILSNSKTPLGENRYTLFVSGNVESESFLNHDNRVAGW